MREVVKKIWNTRRMETESLYMLGILQSPGNFNRTLKSLIWWLVGGASFVKRLMRLLCHGGEMPFEIIKEIMKRKQWDEDEGNWR